MSINKFQQYLFGGLGLLCAGGVVFAGAWWHLFTALICYIMYEAFEEEEAKESDKSNINNK